MKMSLVLYVFLACVMPFLWSLSSAFVVLFSIVSFDVCLFGISSATRLWIFEGANPKNSELGSHLYGKCDFGTHLCHYSGVNILYEHFLCNTCSRSCSTRKRNGYETFEIWILATAWQVNVVETSSRWFDVVSNKYFHLDKKRVCFYWASEMKSNTVSHSVKTWPKSEHFAVYTRTR